MKYGYTVYIVLGLLLFPFAGCEKTAGEGGTSSIRGLVWVTDWNANFMIIQGVYPGVDEWVYLVYDDDVSYGERIRSGPDGRFEFKYLREGKYKVYAYSEDTTLAGEHAVIREIEVSGRNQTVDLDTLKIDKR